MKVLPKTLIIINLLAFIAVLVVNTLSNSLPLFGKTPAQLSDQYPNLFVPTGLTFSIWGIIYTWLLVFIVWQTLALFSPQRMEKVAPVVEQLGWLFIRTCLLNIAWLFMWHLEMVSVSVLVMITLLMVLAKIHHYTHIGVNAISSEQKWLVHAPFSIYLGWISVATIANMTAMLVSIGWSGWGFTEGTWAIIMIIIGALIANIMLIRKNNIFYGLAVAWAFWGIYLKRSPDPSEASQHVASIALLLTISLLIVIALKSRDWLKV